MHTNLNIEEIMTKIQKISTFGILLLVIVGIIAFPTVKKSINANKANKDSQKELQKPKPVTMNSRTLEVSAEIIRTHVMNDQTVTTGNIIPAEEVDLSFETSGKVVAIYFAEGAKVQKGELLAKINDKPLQAQLKKLETQVPLAKDRVYRQKKLLEKNAVSQEAYESVMTEYDKLMADIELVKSNIAQTELYAPFDGVIGLRQLSEGAYATPSTKVAKLSHVDALKIDFSIPEAYANEVKEGTNIVFRLSDNMGITREYDAQVYAVESTIDTDTRTLSVRALFDNQKQGLIPGRYTSVTIKRREIADAISVPSQAIVPEMGRNIVYVYRNGKAQPVEINTGIRTEARVQAIEGLHVGDTLITSGVMQLRTGSPVSITNLK